jgi:hypothetical protein
MSKILVVLIFTVLGITRQALGQTQIESDSQQFKKTLRVLPYIGTFSAGSGNTRVGATELGEGYNSSQYGIAIEWMFVAKGVKAGFGGALYYRNGNTLPDSVTRISNKLYYVFEIGNNRKRKSVSFNFQLGIMEGSFSNRYEFYFGSGPVFNIQKQFHRLNYSLYPFFEYHYSGQKEVSYYDSRYPQGHNGPYTYFLSFTTFSFNLAVIIQYNFLRKNP